MDADDKFMSAGLLPSFRCATDGTRYFFVECLLESSCKLWMKMQGLGFTQFGVGCCLQSRRGRGPAGFGRWVSREQLLRDSYVSTLMLRKTNFWSTTLRMSCTRSP